MNRNVAPKQFYSYFQGVNGKKNDSSISPLITVGQTCLSDSEKSDVLAAQFDSVYTVDNGIYLESVQLCPENSFNIVAITEQDVINAIRLLNRDGSPVHDEISRIVIKTVS